MVPTAAEVYLLAGTNGRATRAHQTGMLSIRFVHFYHFQEILTTEAVVILGPHRNDAHG